MTCDSGGLRNGGDAKQAPCVASQSGNRPNSTTQVIEHLLTDKGLANAVSQHRVGAPSGLSPSVSSKAARRISQGEEQ